MRTTQHVRDQIGKTIEIKWGTSRGRDSYGYTTCSLYFNGVRMAACNGGGYDMRGTVVGNWLTRCFTAELQKLKEKDMPEHSHWQSERARVCAGKCEAEFQKLVNDAIMADKSSEEIKAMKQVKLPDDCFECPTCKGPTHQSREGKTVKEGHYFYGLRFYDPNYDVLDEKLERCDDLFTKPEDIGKTFRQLQKAGKIVDLDVLRKWHNNTSKFPFKKKRVPTIDGACGISSVMQIANAIGIGLNKVGDTKNLDIYVITKHKKEKVSQ